MEMVFRGILLLILAHSLGARAADDPSPLLANIPIHEDETFPADAYIRHQVRFWAAIYLRVGQHEGLLHDPQYPELVFRRIAAPSGRIQGGHAVQTAVEVLQRELRALGRSDSAQWTAEQRRLRALIPDHWDSTALDLCAERVRFQRGIRERFRLGVERSYRYLPAIDSVFAARGIPRRLKYLPHVESSFHPHAYSKVGAAGMWLFMKSSGRRYL
jgi:membrane-bound lytic murein transglycosylase D